MAKGKHKVVRSGLHASPTHLLHRSLQLALDFHTEAAGPSAVTQRQFTVLAAAAAADGLTQNDLVRATGIDRSTLADLVARLLAKGLLRRERSVTDARANVVRLSEKGRDALDAGGQAAADADERLLSLLSPKKRESFLKTLAHLAAVADAPPEARKPRRAGVKAEADSEASPAKVKKKAKKAKSDKADKAAKSGKAARAEVEAAA